MEMPPFSCSIWPILALALGLAVAIFLLVLAVKAGLFRFPAFIAVAPTLIFACGWTLAALTFPRLGIALMVVGVVLALMLGHNPPLILGVAMCLYFLTIPFQVIIENTGYVPDKPLSAHIEGEAKQVHNQVIDSRFLVGTCGQVKPGYDVFTWRPVLTPFPEFWNSLGAKARVIIVLVHGFNTSFDEAVRNGTCLLSLLQDAGGPSFTLALNDGRLCFFTFCWRGDLGRTAFGAAEQAANNSSSALSSFIRQLYSHFPEADLIVITHSLGARVALEALRGLYQPPKTRVEIRKTWVKCLLMVQPAVRCCEIYRNVVFVGRDPFSWPLFPAERTKQCFAGTYGACIRAAEEVVVTESRSDDVLSRWFDHYRGTRGFETQPSVDCPLGLPYEHDQWLLDHNRYVEMDLSPGRGATKREVAVRDHESLFTDPAVSDLLYRKVLFKYCFLHQATGY